jgi:hypothetical protein
VERNTGIGMVFERGERGREGEGKGRGWRRRVRE